MMKKSPEQKEVQRTLVIPKTLADEKRQSVHLAPDKRGHAHVSFKGFFFKIQFEFSGRVPVDFCFLQPTCSRYLYASRFVM